MKRYRCYFAYITVFALVLAFALTGCGGTPSSETASAPRISETKYSDMVLSETDSTITIQDAEGEKVLNKSPQRVVCLYNSLLDLWYLNGGKAIARVSGDTELPPEAAGLPEAGSMSSIGLEQVVALEPDLVLLTATLDGQREIAKGLKENNISYLLCDLREDPFGSFGRYSYLFSKINQQDKIFQEKIEPVIQSCLDLTEKTKAIKEQPSVAVLYSTPKYVKVETNLSQTGQMVHMLGANNILAPEEAPSDGSVRVDLSFEVLLARNPDYIFVVTMGDEEKCKAAFEQTLLSNPAWSELDAVKENRMFYLPKEYSLNKPNQRYFEAFSYLVDLLYPEFQA